MLLRTNTLVHEAIDMPNNEKKQINARSIEEFYDLLAPQYDTMTSFEKRFVQERPFFQALIRRFHFQSALDAGCGSGFHSILLSQLGVNVTGVDVSTEMLRLAQDHARANNVQLRTLQGAFENLGDLMKERFASVFVMGNSLVHLLSSDEVEKALRNFAEVLEPRGILVIQILNYERVLAARAHIQNEKQAGAKTFVRSYDYDDTGVLFNILTREQKDVTVEERMQTIRLRPVLHTELMTLLKRVGFVDIELFGGITLLPFDAANSKDLVVLASKKR
jgi:glycine/sarcosine N-methyltransferase